MQTGKETWKWGVVVLLLAILLITANQAYQGLEEEYAPPDDYTKGDSWDLEHQSGPGAGQPMQMPENKENSNASNNSTESKNLSSEKIEIEDDIDWGMDEPSEENGTPKENEPENPNTKN